MVDDEDSRLEALISECDAESARSLRAGRRHYFSSYILMMVSVVASVLAGIMALFDSWNKDVIGAVALIPALCAGVGGQLKLVPKANWYYRRSRLLKAYSRKLHVVALGQVGQADIDTVTDRLNQIEADLELQWEGSVDFSFADDGKKIATTK